MRGTTSIATLFAVTALLLVALAPGAIAATPAYALTVNVYVSPTGTPTPNGLTVALASGATGLSCNGKTNGGSALFTSTTCPVLTAGWWHVTLPPQMLTIAGNSWLVTPSNASGLSVTLNQTNGGSATVSLYGVSITSANATVTGTVRGVLPGSTYHVELLDPTFPGFIINSTDSAASTPFSLDKIPWGTWTLYAYGFTNQSFNYLRYNYTSVVVNGTSVESNLTLQNYFLSGHYMLAKGVFNSSTNVSLWDVSTHHSYPSHLPASGSTYYQVGLYPESAGTAGGNQSFVVFLSPQGYSSAWENLTVNATSPTPSYFNPAIHPEAPESYSTTVAFLTNFTVAQVESQARFGPDATFSQLPNATLGNLWAQIGLDFNNSIPLVGSQAYASFLTWLGANGPIYPAQEEGLAVNGTVFQDNGRFNLSLSPFSGAEAYFSHEGLSYNTSTSYLLPTPLRGNNESFSLTFGFNYPTSAENLSYTLNLPSGYVLKNGTSAPAGTSLLPAGPPVGPEGKLWTSFTLIPHSFDRTNGTATFTIYRISNVTAVVNATSPNFAFGTRNILNNTHANYTLLVGAGQNVSFTASHSLVPATMNVTNYEWNFGNGSLAKSKAVYSQWVNTTNTTAHHIYRAGGVFHGYLTLFASGGKTNTTSFTVYVDNIPPSPDIQVNSTHVVSLSSTVGYLYVNWSAGLKFNATGSHDAINGATPREGLLAVALWNISAGPTYRSLNYSVSNGSRVFNNVTYQFFGAGPYVKNGTTLHYVMNNTIVSQNLTLRGWLYRVSLTLWDGGANRANATLYVLVNDTEKPMAIGSVQNAEGKNATSGVIVEARNGTANIGLLDNYSYDPHNGSLASYNWSVTNTAGAYIQGCHVTAKLRCYWNQTLASPSEKPRKWTLYLNASTETYNFTLAVTDLAGNKANVTYPLTVAQNTSWRPILTLTNLTVPTTMSDGSTYTLWVDVNNTGFATSAADNVSIRFYWTNPSGSGETPISGIVQWFGYVKGVANSTAAITTNGILPEDKANVTWRAEIKYTVPNSFTGTKELWANGSASNEFPGEYASGLNVAHQNVVVNPNPLTQTIEYVAIAVAVVVVLGLAFFLWRRKKLGPSVKKEKSEEKK